MPGAIAVKRGCGTRKKGGVYFETGMSENGSPLEDFLFDPAWALPHNFDISPLGVKLHQIGNTWHIVDWIGESHYPNVMDFTEEVRMFGLSRRLPKDLDFSKLDHNSRILVVHPRAIINNFLDMPFLVSGDCPKGAHWHEGIEHRDCCCIGYWRYDITGGEKISDEVMPWGPLSVHSEDKAVLIPLQRKMPSFVYFGYEVLVEGQKGPRNYSPGIFGSFPASRLVVVKDDNDAHLSTLNRIQGMTGLDVEEVDQ